MEERGEGAGGKKRLLGEKEVAYLESQCGSVDGYFYRMLEYLEEFVEKGIEEGLFTEQEAHEDLEIALWFSYICNNLDVYEYYYRAAVWMKDSEKNAKGCGTWYYRYSVALTYCGRVQEALAYSEEGVRQEPDYPWGWLQLGKLRAHFQDREGALAAAEQGLLLVPGDYEFQTLKKEIEEGRTLEEMEYHWIDPGCDEKLQKGLDESADDKQWAIAGILCREEGLSRIRKLFGQESWETVGGLYFGFHYPVLGNEIMVVFRMNEAAASKLDLNWLKAQKEKLDEGTLLNRRGEEGEPGVLEAALIDRGYLITLIYREPETGEGFAVRCSFLEELEEFGTGRPPVCN